MTDNMMPELTLEPTAAAEAVPQLTLEPTAPEVPEPEEKKIEPVEMDEKLLTDEEKKAVEEFSHKIAVRDTNMILQYGAAAQKSVAGFSESALNNVRSKDLGEIGQDLSRLVVELKGFGDGEEKKGLMGLFKKAGNRLESMKAQYGKVEANVEKIAQSLEQHQITLLKDVAMFDQMYELNLKYYKELTMYILAGKKRLEEVRSGELEELRKKAEQSGTAEDAQAYNDLVNLCNRFEKKIHDLELTRMVSVQMGPQTRLLQNNDTLMIEKIQSSLVNTIPPVEEPDGAGAGAGAQPSGHGGSERRDGDDQRAAEEERRHPEDGDHRHRQGGRALHRGHRDAAAHQPAAHRVSGRGGPHPAGGRRQAQGGRGPAGPHRGRTEAEAAGAAWLS